MRRADDKDSSLLALLSRAERCEEPSYRWPSEELAECGELATFWVNGSYLCPRHGRLAMSRIAAKSLATEAG